MGALAAEEVRCLRPWLPTVTTPLHAVAGALAEEEVVLEAVIQRRELDGSPSSHVAQLGRTRLRVRHDVADREDGLQRAQQQAEAPKADPRARAAF